MRLLRPGTSNVRVAALVEPGAEPRSQTLAHLQAVLRRASLKPVTVRDISIDAGSPHWTSAGLEAVADRAAPAQEADSPVVSMLFVHGDYGGDAGVLGVAVRGDVAAVFVDQLGGSSGLFGDVGPIEEAVSTHELGHLLGLVDLVLHTGRQDPDHPGHSQDKASVMYWAVETDLIGQLLGDVPPTDFDAADQADLATIRSS